MSRHIHGTIALDPSAILTRAGSSAVGKHSKNRRGSNAVNNAAAASISVAGNAMASAYLSLTDLGTEYDALLAEADLILALQECRFVPHQVGSNNTHHHFAENGSPDVDVAPPTPVLESVEPLRAELTRMSHDKLVNHCIMLHSLIAESVRRGGFKPGWWGSPSALKVGGEQPSLTFDESLLSTSYAPVRTTNELVKTIEEDGTKLINHYNILDELGRGSCGKVKLAFDPIRSTMVAIKIVRRRQSVIHLSQQEKNAEGALEREIAVMKKLRHKNIVSLYEVIDDPEAHKLYLVMQHVDNGAIGVINPSTFTCEPIPADELLDYTRQILGGLEYLHSHDVIHRDIKPENILISKEGQCYLADFGVSEMFERNEQVISGIRGTKLFMAPELLARQEGGGSGSATGRAVDMWALGVTLYALLLGKLPFVTENDISTSGNPELPIDLDRIWTQLIRGMLDRDPRTRLSAKSARALVKEALHLGRRSTQEGGRGLGMTSGGGAAAGLWACTDEDLSGAITPMICARVRATMMAPPTPSLASNGTGGAGSDVFVSIPRVADSVSPTAVETTYSRISLGTQQEGSQSKLHHQKQDDVSPQRRARTACDSNLSGSTAAPSTPVTAGYASEVSSPIREPVDMSLVRAKVAETHRLADETKSKLAILVEEQRRVESSRLVLKPYPL